MKCMPLLFILFHVYVMRAFSYCSHMFTRTAQNQNERNVFFGMAATACLCVLGMWSGKIEEEKSNTFHIIAILNSGKYK